MDLETLRGFADLMEEHGLTRIKLEEKDLKLEIEREAPACAPAYPGVDAATALSAVLGAMPATPQTPAPVPACAPAPFATPVVAEPVAAQQTASGATEVCAPMVGVFYVAPSPGAEPFVHVGSKVKKGETLCILEAMKLMNEVVAECDGEIAEICANDGDLVEYGRVLFRIY